SSTTKQGEGTLAGSKEPKVSAAMGGSPVVSDKVEVRIFDDFPRQAMLVHRFHEWIGIHLFHVPHACALPLTLEHHLGADHGGHTGSVGNRLRADFLVAGLVIADVVDDDRTRLAVLDTGDVTTD